MTPPVQALAIVLSRCGGSPAGLSAEAVHDGLLREGFLIVPERTLDDLNRAVFQERAQ